VDSSVRETTKAFFIVSSGRSGTAMLHKALSAVPGVEMHHEYMVHIVQPLAVRRYLGLANAAEARAAILATHAAAIRYSAAMQWGDSSNKLSWLIPDLAAALPEARFVHLVRDGRKVAGSYYRKLGDECYDDRSTGVLQAHYDDPAQIAAPPPEKKYWWPVPRRGDPMADAFRRFSQFERICWHWAEINRVVLDELARLPVERHIFLRLEDLRASPAEVQRLYRFLGLPYRDSAFSVFARPHNVNRPEDRLLDARERKAFDRIAAPVMTRLGYAGRDEYVVNY
jgi:Sulfotransferase family